MALGMGLDGLLGDAGESITTLRLTDIEPNKDQPRGSFDAEHLNELADSIREHGLLQPIIVRPLSNGVTYQIVAGERRWRAAKIAGLKEIPVLIREVDELQMNRIAIIENIQRQDLDPVEEATAYRRLIEQYGMTHEELSKSIGKSRPYITNILRVLTLPDSVTDRLRAGDISTGHAKAMLALADKDKYDEVLEKILKGHLNVRQTEKLVEQYNSQPAQQTEKFRPENKFYVETALSLKEQTGRNVNVKAKGKGGVLSIEFFSNEDLMRLTELLAK